MSLIDNTVAQFCTLKRAQGLFLPILKKFKSESVVYDIKAVMFSYRNNRVPASTVTIVSSCTAIASSLHLEANKEDDNMCPYDFIKTMISDSAQGQVLTNTKPLHESDFLSPVDEEILADRNGAIAAVHVSDVEASHQLHAGGQTLQCCNRYDKSLLHAACWHSDADVLSFLINKANVSPHVRDDYGCTPLHDACWRGNPEYEIVELLLAVESRLAFVADIHGHKPFQYTHREHWGAWRDFLHRKKDLILPKECEHKLTPLVNENNSHYS